MTAWVLSICGVSILSVLIDLFLPDGKTNKHIKNVFSYVIVLTIIAPIPTLLKSERSIEQIINIDEIEIYDDYIYQLNRYKLDTLEQKILDDITEKGIVGVDIAISANIFTYDMQISAIFVDFFDLVINENMSHIDIEKVIIECINNNISIEKEKIIFNE